MDGILIEKKQKKDKSLGKYIYRSRFLIMMIIPAIVYYILFCYVPMYGVLIAFTDFSSSEGIMGSVFNHWIGLKNFETIFNLQDFWRVFLNTIFIGTTKVIIAFVSAVTVALLINEIRLRFFKKAVQIIVTFPHFLSWVIVASLFILMFSDNGSINQIIRGMGGNTVGFLSEDHLFLGLIFGSDIWKEAGWGSIIYIATMAGISTDLYEAADIDGATRLQKIWHITLPGIKATAILLLIMSVGGVLSAGFEQIFNMSNDMVEEASEIIDTYIYNTTFVSHQFREGVTTALGLFKSLVGFILVITTDRIAKACGERGII